MEELKVKLSNYGYILEESLNDKVFLTYNGYVCKIFEGRYYREGFLNEKTIYNILAGKNLTPQLINTFEFVINKECFGVLILERLEPLKEITKELTDVIYAKIQLLEQSGVIHGDLSWENILLRDDEPYFIDFEISLILDPLTGRQLKGTYDTLSDFAQMMHGEDQYDLDTEGMYKYFLDSLISRK